MNKQKPKRSTTKQKKKFNPASVIIVIILFGFAWWYFMRPASVPVDTTTKQPKKSQTTVFNKRLHSTYDPSSPWVIVNKTRSLEPLNYTPGDLVPIGNDQLMRKEAADALQNLIKSAANEGLNIAALSGYRSYKQQQGIYASEVAAFGQAQADTQSAKPGTSEHQTGWAVDVGGGGCGIEDCFGNTKEGKWVAANANRYGFIVRYTAPKQSITGYRGEPWHIRYFGKELAAELTKTGQTPEEFFGLSK